MNFYLFDRTTYGRLYNCSVLPTEEWERRKNPNPIGYFYLLLATIDQVFYIPFLTVMLRKQFFQHSCYKLMFFMGVIDVFATIVGGTLMGIFLIRGDYFCTNQDFLYITSCFTNTCWVAGCMAGLILILNRLLDLAYERSARYLFGFKRTYYWLALPILYGGYCVMFTKPFLINAWMDSLFNNPFVGMDDIHYLNLFVFYHNFGTAAVFPVLHVSLCVILIVKTRGGQTAVSKFQKQMIIQSILISAFLVIASLTFVYMQLWPVGHVYMVFSHISWLSCHGAPVFTYIFINKSMRTEVVYMLKRMVGKQPLARHSIHRISNNNPKWLGIKDRVSQKHLCNIWLPVKLTKKSSYTQFLEILKSTNMFAGEQRRSQDLRYGG